MSARLTRGIENSYGSHEMKIIHMGMDSEGDIANASRVVKLKLRDYGRMS
jgi:hypothetical protein